MQVIATAGHVDHGKSTLLRALTGMDPDRWEEERRRGLTIDLGFAWLTLPSGEQIAFVDVPGHERFVPNMLAGVGPVPAVLFVVAADEGWMPQSAEHLAVVNALGIRKGVLVVTRADLADPGPALADAAARIGSSSLGQVPAVAVSSVTGDGLPALLATLEKLVGALEVPDPGAPVRLWVDRAFSITGVGTVVTGTLPAGTVHSGDELVITPSMRPVRVRGLESLGVQTAAAAGVARVALNLRGASRDGLTRGMALVQSGRWTMTDVIDVRLATEAGAAAPRLPRNVTLHIGSARTVARVRPLAGQFARLSLRDQLPLHVGDRLLLRDPGAARSPRRGAARPPGAESGWTAGSGPAALPGAAAPPGSASPMSATSPGPATPTAASPRPTAPVTAASPEPATPTAASPRPTAPVTAAHPRPDALPSRPAGRGQPGSPTVIGAVVLDVAPPPLLRRGAAPAAAREIASWPDRPAAGDLLRRHGLLRASALLAMGISEHPEPVTGEWLADPGRWADLADALGEAVAAYAARQPLAAGLPVEAARAALGLPDRRLVDALIRPPLRIRDGQIQIIAPAGAAGASGLPGTLEVAVEIIRAGLADAPFLAPDADRLRGLGLDLRSIAAAERAGLLLRISDQIVLAPGADKEAACILAGLPQPFTAADARQALHTTRRTAIPLLEYLDRAGITQRLPDDRRILRTQ